MGKKLTNAEKCYLLQFLLACCSVVDSIDEESKGEKMACFTDTLINDDMANLIQKANNYFFGDEIMDDNKLVDNKIYAKCIQKSDDDCLWLKHDLELNKFYEVQNIYMGQSNTSIILKDRKQVYNSVYFEFYESGKKLDIYSDKRFNCYL